MTVGRSNNGKGWYQDRRSDDFERNRRADRAVAEDGLTHDCGPEDAMVVTVRVRRTAVDSDFECDFEGSRQTHRGGCITLAVDTRGLFSIAWEFLRMAP